MIELKRMQSSTDHQTLTSVAHKRQKADKGASMSTKETKEKVGERIVALQQLVSPFGKTDTASVLLEAVDYIRFLHEQVKVLSAPYLHCGPITETEEQEEYSLRMRGLCLMPIASTVVVAQSNGADIWTPIKTASNGF